MERNLIERIAKNNPLLDDYGTLQVNDIFFYKEEGKIKDTDHINVPIDKFFSDNTIVCIKSDGYVVEDLYELNHEDRVEVGVAPIDNAVVVPYNLCSIYMNDEGITRETIIPF